MNPLCYRKNEASTETTDKTGGGHMVKHIWKALPIFLLMGCATTQFVPPGPYAALTPQLVSARNLTGSRVRWGGVLVATRPEASQTCFEVLALPLNSDGEPRLERTLSEGRFIACSQGFFDPALYAQGREITLAGDIVKIETHRIGGYEYRFPVLKSGPPHLWPRIRIVRYMPGPCWSDPFCNPWGWPGYYPYYPWWR